MRVVLRPVLAGGKTSKIMTKRRHRQAPEQIVRKIRDADRILDECNDVAAVLRQLNVTEATHYPWRNGSGGPQAEDAKQLKHLEKQNLELKKLLAEEELEKAVSKELAEGNF
jgi:putative transposase